MSFDSRAQNGLESSTCTAMPFPKNVEIRPRVRIDELVRDEDVERVDIFFERAHRTRREDVLDAEKLEAEDIGTEVELARKQLMSFPVTSEKGDRLAGEFSGDVVARWIPNGVSRATSSTSSSRPFGTGRSLR